MLIKFLRSTAWPIVTPSPHSAAVIIFSLVGVFGASLTAYMTASRHPQKYAKLQFGCGLFLGISELYKQLFLFYIVGNGSYDWWYFPFQLCSIPMYLCLILPFLPHGKLQRSLQNFLAVYGLLGGLMALVIPDGLLHPWLTLTIHGFLWHFILIFLALHTVFCGQAWIGCKLDGGNSEFPASSFCLILFCGVAILLNILFHPLGNQDADMFYLSPYFPSTQPGISEISFYLGIPAGMAVYVAAMLSGGFLCCWLERYLADRMY